MMDSELDSEHTMPPKRSLRIDSPQALYRSMPEVGIFTKHRPNEHEDALGYLERLRSSTTPEDAVTYAAFAAEPKMAISWGVDCVRMNQPNLSPEDSHLANAVLQWLEYPGHETRWHAMQSALFAPRRTPLVYLGLAVGWSGGPMAPNDPSAVPLWRTPKAVNAAVLSSIATLGLDHRSVSLARVLDLAAGLFRIY